MKFDPIFGHHIAYQTLVCCHCLHAALTDAMMLAWVRAVDPLVGAQWRVAFFVVVDSFRVERLCFNEFKVQRSKLAFIQSRNVVSWFWLFCSTAFKFAS
jgi:hypothetical protein